MKKSLKSVYILISIFIMLAPLSGCFSKENLNMNQAGSSTSVNPLSQQTIKKVKIRYAHCWGPGPGKGQVFEDMLAKFKEENKNILDLQEEISYGDELRNKIKVDVASNNLSDVFNFWGYPSNIQPFVENNLVLDISEYLKESKTLNMDSYSDNAWNLFRYKDGKIYGVPLEGYDGYFLINKKLFDKYNLKYPRTYEDLLSVSKVFNENGIIPLAMASKGGNPGHLLFSEFYMQYGEAQENMNELLKGSNFQPERALKAAKLIDEMRKDGVFPADTIANGDWGPSFALYNEEKAAMVYLFTWEIPLIRHDVESVSALVAPPKVPGAVTDPQDFSIGGCNHGVMVNKQSFNNADKRDLIVKLIDFITSDDMFEQLAKSSVIPAKKGVNVDPTKTDPLFAEVLDNYGELSHYAENSCYFSNSNTYDVYMASIDELFAGIATPDQFVSKVRKAMIKP